MGFKYRGRSRTVMTSFATTTVTKFAERRVREAAVHAISHAIRLSPYASGQFIASWRLNIGSKDPTHAPPGQRSRDSAAGEAIASSINAISNFKLGQTIVLSNSVRHAQFVEYGSPTTEPRYITKRVKASVRMRFKGVG